MQTFKSFADLANAMREQDIARAANLRRAGNLPAPKIGPKVAR